MIISILLTLFVNEIYRAKLYFLFQFAVNTSISIISGMLKSCSESFRIYYYYRVINVFGFRLVYVVISIFVKPMPTLILRENIKLYAVERQRWMMWKGERGLCNVFETFISDWTIDSLKLAAHSPDANFINQYRSFGFQYQSSPVN